MPRKLSQKELQERIAERISEVLLEKNWTQQVLVERTGFPKSYVSKIMHGDANLTLATIVRLSEALGVYLIQ